MIDGDNMKKKILVIVLFVLCGLFTYDNVYAAREICSTRAYSDLRTKAYGVSFSYELKFNEDKTPYFELTYSGLKEGVELRVGENSYTYNENGATGKISTTFQNTGATYEFSMYGEYGYACVGELLYTKKVKLPKYNRYSEYDECIEYEEFPLCNKWYDGEITNDDYFYQKLEEYKESLKPVEEPIEEKEEEKDFFQKAIDFYVNNLIFTLPITILIVLTIVFIIVKNKIKKKKRVKIDFDFKV